MTRNFRSRPVGWRGESRRHYLASKGIVTRRFVRPKQYFSDDDYPGGSLGFQESVYYEDKDVNAFEALHREGVRRERIPDFNAQVDLADEEIVILDRLKADDELASDGFKSAIQVRYDEAQGRFVDPRFARSAARVDKRYYNYVPTYAVGDMSLIAADGVGTAGAAVIPLIPIIVPAVIAYGGAKYVADKKKKTGSYFAIKRKHAEGVWGYEDTDSGEFFHDVDSAVVARDVRLAREAELKEKFGE